MKRMLACTILMQICGGIIYGSAEALSAPSLIIVGRFVAEIGSTNIAICQKFVISTSSLKNRSAAIAALQVSSLS